MYILVNLDQNEDRFIVKGRRKYLIDKKTMVYKTKESAEIIAEKFNGKSARLKWVVVKF